MTIELIRFEPGHVRELTDWGGQQTLQAYCSESDYEVAAAHDSYSAVADGKIIACAGIIGTNRFRGVAWALLAKVPPPIFLQVHRAVICGLERQPYAVVGTYVKPTFTQGMRWARRIGFQLDRAYIPYMFPDGSGASEWSYYPRRGS